ncbi:MAG: DUF2271 domain-containing protein [Acidimicrobiales bacterium]
MDRPDDLPELPRFEAAQRRLFLKRAAALGVAALVPGVLAACSKDDDKDAFSNGTTTTVASSGSSAATTTTAAGSSGSSTTAAAGEDLPASAKLDVAFTYTADGQGFGPARNPFIVAWVEDASGDLIANISLWYNPPKGERWINNLTSWYSAASAYYSDEGSIDLDSVTGATRPAGSYTVTWDGSADAGGRAKQGEYTVFVESAREHGTHSLTSAKITLGTDKATATLDDNGELSAATATYAV